MSDNYIRQVLHSRELFLRYDQETMIRKFQLSADESYLYLPFLDRTYRICRKTGRIDTDGVECLDYNIAMTIYDILCCSKTAPVLAHQWCSLGSLQVTPSSPSDQTFLKKYETAFAGKADLLKDICAKIGGTSPHLTAGADVCWEFQLFPFLPVQFRFWEPDDEFPAQIKLLWDKNTLDFMHFETVYYAMHALMKTLEFFVLVE